MGVETAADVAAYFETDEFAVEASWRLAAGGPPTTVPMILDRARQVSDLGEVRVQSDQVVGRCAVAALPEGYGRLDTVTVGSDVWRVSRVDLDIDRTVAEVVLKVSG